MRRKKEHHIKILPDYFGFIVTGRKQFELRKNDRDFRPGDRVILQEFDEGHYTGQEISVKIKYVLKDVPEYGLMDGYCIFGW